MSTEKHDRRAVKYERNTEKHDRGAGKYRRNTEKHDVVKLI